MKIFSSDLATIDAYSNGDQKWRDRSSTAELIAIARYAECVVKEYLSRAKRGK